MKVIESKFNYEITEVWKVLNPHTTLASYNPDYDTWGQFCKNINVWRHQNIFPCHGYHRL